ncbi:MAG: protoporphyrinogen oxidase [Acidimicrobiales bacterium]
MTQVEVVGGGITGLVAARAAAIAGADVTLVEPGPLGGKVRSSAFDGGVLDEAADAFLARVPEGVELCRELGIEGDLVSPAARRAHVWSRGALRPLPIGQVLGVPTDLDEMESSGILSPAGMARVRQELVTPLARPADDVTIGALMRHRLGDEAAERLVDPLVGGINAGDTDQLSLAATVPQLDAAARSGQPSLIEACQAQRAAGGDPDRPVFFAPKAGMGALVAALVRDLEALGVQVVRDAVAAIERDGAAWRVHLTGDFAGADGIVLAAPAGPVAELLRPLAARAATLLAGIPYASVALISLAVPRDAIDRELDGSGFLVPRVEGRTITACSWTSQKWPHLAGDASTWLRASVGRDGAGAALDLPDDALVGAVLADLSDTMALHGRPTETRVSRWAASFPQYRPGHLDRVEIIDAELVDATPGLALAGAALRGLGVPACIRQGQAAARRVLSALDARA